MSKNAIDYAKCETLTDDTGNEMVPNLIDNIINEEDESNTSTEWGSMSTRAQGFKLKLKPSSEIFVIKMSSPMLQRLRGRGGMYKIIYNK